ncbi:MAG TPA: hypothetical protein VK487_05350 [Candidatus Bathyarchaeia archaeon]|nr:hypothetical protein [Candidatus Bathyarchaeia archaeon]
MDQRRLSIVLLAFFCASIIPSIAQAATITSCTFDRTPYYPGQTGSIAVTLYNDQASKIRITDLTAAINYYYNNEVSYQQTFLSNATLPVQVQTGINQTLYIPFSLPTNIAPGCTQLSVAATVQLWNNSTGSWNVYNEQYPSYSPTLYIESPYKPQLLSLQATNNATTIMMYLLAFTTVLFAGATAFFYLVARRIRNVRQNVA